MGFAFGSATHKRGTVGGTSLLQLAANTSRKYLRIQNEIGGPAFINFGGAAAVDNGSIALVGPGTAGVNVIEFTRGAGNLYTGAVYAICSGSAHLGIIEGT